MSFASFHYAYRSRDDLLLEVMQRVLDAEMTAAFRVLGPDADIRRSVRRGLSAFLDCVMADPGQERAVQELVHHALFTPGLEHLARARYRSYHRAVVELLVEAAHAAGVRWVQPVADVARFVVTVTDGLTLVWLADRDAVSAGRMIELAVDSISALAEPRSHPVTSTPTARSGTS